MKGFAVLVAIWGFLIAPQLCRAQLLGQCCESRPCPITCPDSCEEEDCNDKCPIPHDAPGHRDCGSCAQVCKSVTLPAQQKSALDEPAPSVLGNSLVDCELAAASPQFIDYFEASSFEPGLPYAPCDRPRLI